MTEELKDKYYKLQVACANCGKGSAYDTEEYEIFIPKGITADDYFAKFPCEYCGCHTLTKIIPYVAPVVIDKKKKKEKEDKEEKEEEGNGEGITTLNTDMPSIFKKKPKMRVKKIIK